MKKSGHYCKVCISDIIDYVKNPDKTDHGRLITSYQCDSRVADAQFLLDKQTYAARTGRVRGADDVIAYHLRQSFVPGEITPEEANRLGVELARRFHQTSTLSSSVPTLTRLTSTTILYGTPPRWSVTEVPKLLGQHPRRPPPERYHLR